MPDLGLGDHGAAGDPATQLHRAQRPLRQIESAMRASGPHRSLLDTAAVERGASAHSSTPMAATSPISTIPLVARPIHRRSRDRRHPRLPGGTHRSRTEIHHGGAAACRPSVNSTASSIREAGAAMIRRRAGRPQARAAAAQGAQPGPSQRADRPPTPAPTSRPAGERLRRLRTVCLIEVLYATGLRVSELVGLPAAAARARDAIIVLGKGGKERLVPLSEPAKAAMAPISPRARIAAGGLALAIPHFGGGRTPHRQHAARETEGSGSGRRRLAFDSVTARAAMPSPAICWLMGGPAHRQTPHSAAGPCGTCPQPRSITTCWMSG